MRRPDSLNLVIKTWYYVSWGSNKYHQLYPVLIEQNKNLSDKTFPQAGILFWTVALSQCIGILVATISFRFECFLSRDFLELYQNWNLKISISKNETFLSLSRWPDCYDQWSHLFTVSIISDRIASSEIDWISRWRMFSQAKQSNSKEITTYTHFLAIKQMRTRGKRPFRDSGQWKRTNIRKIIKKFKCRQLLPKCYFFSKLCLKCIYAFRNHKMV